MSLMNKIKGGKMDFYITRYKNIEKQTYEVEVITPMFLAGSDKDIPELRTPSFKGMLRFWWRALNPHLAKNGYGDLKEEEAILFGDSGKKYGKSKTKIIIKYDSLSMGKFRPLPHSKKKKFKFPCINFGQRFTIILIAPKEVHSLFKLFSIIGGVGKRNRRGFGCFRIINGAQEVNLKLILQLINDTIKNDNIYKIQNSKIQLNQNYSLYYPYVKLIEIGTRNYKSYNDILIQIGQSSHDHNSDFTGFAKGKYRFASPIYVSVFKQEQNYFPILTTLNIAYRHPIRGQNTINDFKNDIL